VRACYRESALYSLILMKEAFYAEISLRSRTHTPPFPLELGRYGCGTFGVGVRYINEGENGGVVAVTNLTKQRRLAADILKVGVERVWIDPEAAEEVSSAITREDIRKLIEEGIIKRKQKKGVSRGRARERARKRKLGRRRGHGSRKGTKYARLPRKRRWIMRIRALRRRLRELRDEGRLDRRTYRLLYRRAKGGMFKSVAHLEEYIRANNLATLETETGGRKGGER